MENRYTPEQALQGRYIIELLYDYTPAMCTNLEGCPETFRNVKVGVNGVEDIQEHAAAGEGDKWFYDIYHEDGTVIRTFNPYTVFYKPINQSI